ncbi:cytochrome C [candidate division GN15 bacterium]|nr:cytochrome C [candidate division GN15 bacterium]
MNIPYILLTPPVPRDLALELPLDPFSLEILLVGLFLLHILFVNLMVGGAILTVFFELLGRLSARYDRLAREIGKTITVNKSLAVVLGVGPLLCISLLYTAWFYAANGLTGNGWILIVPLVILAFLFSYAHKYTWERWTGRAKQHHIVLGAASAILFMSIPFIFLANINLMLFPDRWTEVSGFFSSLQIGNVFPRYFHFLTASIAITGLFLSGWFSRKNFPMERVMPTFTRPEVRRMFYKLAFWATVAQVAFGPLLFVTLPSVGITFELLAVILTGVALAAIILAMMWKEVTSADHRIGRLYWPIVAAFTVLVVFMATGRHVYREASIDDHRQLVVDRTDKFQAVELATLMRIEAGLGVGQATATGPTGESVFKNCAACHAVDKVLAAPSLREVYSIYADNPSGIVDWAKDPGVKRPEFAPMPSFAHLGDEQLELVAEYMLEVGAPEGQDSGSDGESM